MSSPQDLHTERARPRKRIDALSLFLGVSMATLVLMYALDSREADLFIEHDTLAAQIPLGPLAGPCTAMAVGAGHDGALITCASLSRQESRDRLHEVWTTMAPPPAWLKHVALRDDTGTLMCSRTLEGCTDHILKDRDAMKASRRRPPRQ